MTKDQETKEEVKKDADTNTDNTDNNDHNNSSSNSDSEPLDNSSSNDDFVSKVVKETADAVKKTEDQKKSKGKYQKNRAKKELDKKSEDEEKGNFLKVVAVVAVVLGAVWYFFSRPTVSEFRPISHDLAEKETEELTAVSNSNGNGTKTAEMKNGVPFYG